jgi:hypothetical protein
MNRKFDVRSLLIGAVLGAVIVFVVAAANNKQPAWEYTAYYYSTPRPDMDALKKLGNEGWELATYFDGPDGKSPGFIFMRER